MEGTFLGTFRRAKGLFYLMTLVLFPLHDRPLPAGFRREHLRCISPLQWEAQGGGTEPACEACPWALATAGMCCAIQKMPLQTASFPIADWLYGVRTVVATWGPGGLIRV